MNYIELVPTGRMGRTSIPLTEETRNVLAEAKPDGVTWDNFALTLLHAYETQDDVDGLPPEQYEDLVQDVASETERRVVNSLVSELRG